MKLSTLLPLSLPLLQFTTAWEITWHDASNKAHTRTGHGPSDCIVIDNPKGHLFKIDAQGENNINMLLFTNSKCSGEPAGMATQEFSKDSSEALLGFKVVSTATPTSTGETTATATTATVTGKAGGHNSTMTTTTLSSQTASSSSSGGSGTATGKTTGATGTAATTTSETSSAASATTTNAAVQLAASNGYLANGLVGGVLGLAMVQWVV